jgi:hypothetical protein
MILNNTLANSFVDTGLLPGRTYYYVVRSISETGTPSENVTKTAGTTTGGTATPSPTTPVTPATPATPATPGVSPATPAIPATPPAKAINARLFDYRASWVSQSGTISADKKAHEVSGTPGQVIDLELTLKNIGAAPWKADWTDAAHWIKLGTWNPKDAVSPLYHSSWLSNNRITVANVTVNQNGSYTFRFKVQIPSTATAGMSYKFYVRPVAEYVEWFGATGIFWNVKVV